MEQTKLDEALGTVKMLLGIGDNEQDRLLSFLVSDAVNMVLGYCRIEELPEGLYSVIPMIAADMYRAYGYGSADAPRDVKSISQGQESVSFDVKRPDAASILHSYHRRLAPFVNRRGRVPSDIG